MLDLPAIKKLCEAATHEPWAVFYDEGLGYGIVSPDWEMGYIPYDAAEFIAQARTLVPQLVEALEEAQKASEEYENRWIATQDKLQRVGECLPPDGGSPMVETIRAILGESE